MSSIYHHYARQHRGADSGDQFRGSSLYLFVVLGFLSLGLVVFIGQYIWWKNFSTEENVEAQLSPQLIGMFSKEVLLANTIYVIPGGGGSKDNGYPEWTRQRVTAAYDHSIRQHKDGNKKPIFLALSAGSLNSPNVRKDDQRVIFECQHMIKHLHELGVENDRIFGDFVSWDTVANGLVLRMVVEGMLATSIATAGRLGSASSVPSVNVEVFISDFHAERVKATFDWILGLSPSLTSARKVKMTVHSVNSEGVEWGSKQDFETRIQHEKRGVELIKKNSEMVHTVQELYAFLFLGPHKGYFNYLHDYYKVSKGAGW